MNRQLIEKRLRLFDERFVLRLILGLVVGGEKAKPIDKLPRMAAGRGEFVQRVAPAVALAGFRDGRAEFGPNKCDLVQHSARSLSFKLTHKANHRKREFETAMLDRGVPAFVAS